MLAREQIQFSDVETNGAPASARLRNPDPLRRGVAWGAMLAGSAVPSIICRMAGGDPPYLLPVSQTVLLVLIAIAIDRSPRLRPLTGFLLSIAIVRLGWFAIAPLLSDWKPIHDVVVRWGWGAQMFFSRLMLTAGAVLLAFTFIGRNFSRRDLFLQIGNLSAPAEPEAILWFRKPVPWTRLGSQLLLIFGVALPIFLFATLRPDLAQFASVWKILPWALATAAINAANEEFQFRCVPLAHLQGVLPPGEILWLTAAFFGIGHYFGQPSGLIGVVMASFAGWIWAKSMVETRGAGWAFGIHMVQDVVIFCFLAVAAKA